MHTDEYPKALKRRQEGFTLIEIMIALAIVAVAIALAIKPVHQALSNAKANDEMGELPTIIANIQKVFANRANFGGNARTICESARIPHRPGRAANGGVSEPLGRRHYDIGGDHWFERTEQRDRTDL